MTSNAALQGADVVMSLRIQKERLAGRHHSVEDYIARYQVTPQRMKLAKPDAILMHPGPIDSRHGDDQRSGRRPAVVHSRAGAQRSQDAHGNSGDGAGAA